jgi:hypothetical protein
MDPVRQFAARSRAATTSSNLGAEFDTLQTMDMTHGQALWILAEFGFNAGTTAGSFNYNIKSLRKLGIPFIRGRSRVE